MQILNSMSRFDILSGLCGECNLPDCDDTNHSSDNSFPSLTQI